MEIGPDIFDKSGHSDVRVRVKTSEGEKILDLHWVILTTQCSYFSGVFNTKDSIPLQNNTIDFTNQEHSAEVIITTLKFIYGINELKNRPKEDYGNFKFILNCIEFADYLGAKANIIRFLVSNLKDAYAKTIAFAHSYELGKRIKNDDLLRITLNRMLDSLDLCTSTAIPSLTNYITEIFDAWKNKVSESDKFMIIYRLRNKTDKFDELISRINMREISPGNMSEILKLEGVKSMPILFSWLSMIDKHSLYYIDPINSKIPIREVYIDNKK